MGGETAVFFHLHGPALPGGLHLKMVKSPHTPSHPRARIRKLLRSPGIDSEETIPPAYVSWQARTANRVLVPARQAGNRFLGSLKGLQIRAQVFG